MTQPHIPKKNYPPNGERDNDDGLLDWDELRNLVAQQPEVEPPPEVERCLLAHLRVREAERLTPAPTWRSVTQGVLVAIIVTALLWGLLKPGLVLEWEVEAASGILFRISRAPQKTAKFVTVHELAATSSTGSYRYIDPFVWPGTRYSYRVEALDARGEVLAEHLLLVDGLLALPGQLAVLATGLMVGYGTVVLGQLKRQRGF